MLQRTLRYQQDNDVDSMSLQNDVMTLFSVLYDASSFLNFHKDIFFVSCVGFVCFVFFFHLEVSRSATICMPIHAAIKSSSSSRENKIRQDEK